MIQIQKFEVTIVSEVTDEIRREPESNAVKRERSLENRLRAAFSSRDDLLNIDVELVENDVYGEDLERHEEVDWPERWWNVYDVDGTDKGFHRRDDYEEYPEDDYNEDW